MTKHRRRQKNSSGPVGDVFHFILALALIAAAVVAVVFAAGKIKGITGTLLEKPTKESTAAETEIAVDSGETQAEKAAGFQTDADGNLVFLHEDGTAAVSEWLAAGGALYYANENGILQTGKKSIEGMLYTFDDSGEMTRVRYNRSYKPDKADMLKDYPSLVKTKRVWAFLDEDETLGDFYAVMFKKTTEAMAYRLGTDENPQYASPYTLQIDGDYVYYLALAEDASALSETEEAINATLYRVKPGSSVRQVISADVDGYKVLDGMIFYESDGALYVTQNAEDDPTKNPSLVRKTAAAAEEETESASGDPLISDEPQEPAGAGEEGSASAGDKPGSGPAETKTEKSEPKATKAETEAPEPVTTAAETIAPGPGENPVTGFGPGTEPGPVLGDEPPS